MQPYCIRILMIYMQEYCEESLFMTGSFYWEKNVMRHQAEARSFCSKDHYGGAHGNEESLAMRRHETVLYSLSSGVDAGVDDDVSVQSVGNVCEWNSLTTIRILVYS